MEPSTTPKPSAFTEKDKEKFVELLNFVAQHAEFNGLDIRKMLQFTKLLNWAQVDLLPKIDSHVFEILGIKQAAKDQSSSVTVK